MRSLRASTWRWLGAVALGGGLLAWGVWYVAANDLTRSLPSRLIPEAAAQEIPAPALPAPAATDKKNGRKPMGEVTQITAEPAAFTLRTPAGSELTFSVLDGTVFMAGRDRPYRFDLLKVGDQVVVRGGGQVKAPDGAAATGPAAGGNGKGNQTRAARANAGDGTLIARQVMVRPAGEQRERKKEKIEPAALSPAGTTNGGSDGAGQ